MDVGCGTGEFLVRLAERYDVRGTGIDPDGNALEQCRRRCEGRIPDDRLELHQLEVAAFAWPERPFDAAICIGSTHAFGGFVPTLRELACRVSPGGVILVGDIFWRRVPEQPYRDVIGDEWPPEDTDYAAGLRHGRMGPLRGQLHRARLPAGLCASDSRSPAGGSGAYAALAGRVRSVGPRNDGLRVLHLHEATHCSGLASDSSPWMLIRTIVPSAKVQARIIV